MLRYISCSAKLVCLVSELFSSTGQFCFVSSSCAAQCRAPVICPPLPLSQLFVAGALLTLHWSAGSGVWGEKGPGIANVPRADVAPD